MPLPSIPQLLSNRQEFGLNNPRSGRLYGQRPWNSRPSSLSSAIAWNSWRMQNMVLSVGPGTPASCATAASIDLQFSSDESSSSSDSSTERHADIPFLPASDVEESDDDDDEFMTERAQWYLATEERSTRRRLQEDLQDDPPAARNEERRPSRLASSRYTPSMRHGGCINTAAWLDCSWRLATGHSNSSNPLVLTSSLECPTQVMTSGDDHLVKFWDVSQSMGSSAPRSGYNSSAPPFHPRSKRRTTTPDSASILSGSVLPLCTLPTGHAGNVFHVTPLYHQPGKVATCGADGHLRISCVETMTNSIVCCSPDEDSDDEVDLFRLRLRSDMCFSHHFLNAHTGLLCSQRGLRRFDIRLRPQDQPRGQPVLSSDDDGMDDTTSGCCKACAVYHTSSEDDETVDTTYVFCGGSSADVLLLDLRMMEDVGFTHRQRRRSIVQQYRPRHLSPHHNVSVSGLDISRDRRELLVSYENDQIYTFPIFPKVSSVAGPTLEELRNDSDRSSPTVLSELAAYGGHLNRFTFLKNARYAGPNDEYICTGSDSGHAWFYERSSGAVVSLLNADHSTCNGVIPHPTLPFFVTYGIDSTAKLWRATVPVNSDLDDSPGGRARSFAKLDYEMSPIARKWEDVQKVLLALEDEDIEILPDAIPHTQDIIRGGRSGRSFLSRDGPSGPFIGNDLKSLPKVLRQNLYSCLRAAVNAEDGPVESGVMELSRRISLIRLRYQADQQGLVWNSSIPWILQPRSAILMEQKPKVDGNSKMENAEESANTHPADLVPDHPSDWIRYDPDMTRFAVPCGMDFNMEDYADFYYERYSNLKDYGVLDDDKNNQNPWILKRKEDVGRSPKAAHKQCNGFHPSVEVPPDSSATSSTDGMAISSSEDDPEETAQHPDGLLVAKLLHDTVEMLKEGGNEALQNGDLNIAARRYDKAIQYCSFAFMNYPGRSELGPMTEVEVGQKEKRSLMTIWSPLLKMLIMTRLNMALLLLRPQLAQPVRAAEQARLALQELKPFCTGKLGKVGTKGKQNESAGSSEDSNAETYKEAKGLQAKAYFRLGSAEYEMGEFGEAIRSFEHSIKCTQSASSKPDKLVARRLAEARTKNVRKNKRHRRKFKLMFSGEDGSPNGEALPANGDIAQGDSCSDEEEV